VCVVAAVTYRYELRRGDEIVATGHFTNETQLELGDPVTIGNLKGVVRSIDPVLHERELRVVVQLSPDPRSR
jgi:hypothetical protein